MLNQKNYKKFGLKLAFFAIFPLFLGQIPAFAFNYPHPMKIYEKGEEILSNYKGKKTDLNKAKKIFENIVERYPESPLGHIGISRVNTIDAYLYGDHYNMLKLRDTAVPHALKALEIGPSIKESHDNFALLERIFDQHAAAQENAQILLKNFPNMPETYFTVANFVRDQAKYSKSIEFFSMALELEPSLDLRYKILERISVIYLNELNEPEKAVKYLEKALVLQKDSSIINEYLGLAYFKLKKFDLAVVKLRKSMEISGTENQKFYLLQAKSHIEENAGNYEKAIKYLEEAVSMGNVDSYLEFRLGNLYLFRENYASAYNHFQQVIDLKPGYEKAYFLAGRAAYSLGNKAIALNYYKKYLSLDSKSQEAAWIKNNIPEFLDSVESK